MKFKLDFQFQVPSDLKITHNSSIVLLGSCFSDEMGAKFTLAGFHCLSNPFGTLFHPSAIANNVLNALGSKCDFKINDFGSYCSSWNTNTLLRAASVEEMQALYTEQLRVLKNALQHADVLFVTFGTAWGYVLNEDGTIVANCHKQSSDLFVKKLTQTEDIVAKWNRVIEEVRALNPNLKWIFTVSPVRHSKDGLVENNRSKARLIEACHTLSELSSVNYFPSYEIVMDELRDYRFFKEDMVHPNQQAIDYVWERLTHVLMNEPTQMLIQEVNRLRSELEHRSLNPDSKEEKERILRLQDKVARFQVDHPEIKW